MKYQALLPRRQRIRRLTLTWSLLLFPVTMYYFSPVLSLAGASRNIVTGSVIVFVAQFLVSIVLGRAFCGWACPAGALQEAVLPVQPKPLRPRWTRWVKWAIWVLWAGFLAYLFFSADGAGTVEFAAFTTGGISLTDLSGYLIYYIVLTVFVVLALLLGRRGGCHALCWMAPFMIAGSRIRQCLRFPGLILRAEPERCIACGSCTAVCPMSVPVQSHVHDAVISSSDCILCGECADSCPRAVIRYAISSSARIARSRMANEPD